MSQKKLKQLESVHRLRDKRGSQQFFGVMFRRIEQEEFHIDNPENLIGRIGINRDALMTFLLQARDRFFVRQIIRQHETVDARCHAVLCRFVAQLDDFLNHFGFAFIQGALFFTHLNQGPQFLIAQARTSAQMRRREKIDDISANRLESTTHAIKKRHCYLQRQGADGRESIRRRKRQEFRNQITEQHHDGKDPNTSQPLRNASCERALPQEEKT